MLAQSSFWISFLFYAALSGFFLSCQEPLFGQESFQSLSSLGATSKHANFHLNHPNSPSNGAMGDSVAGEVPVAGDTLAGKTSAIDRSLVTEEPLAKFKKQALQRAGLSTGWLGAANNHDLSATWLDASVRLGIPLGSMDSPLAITPGFRVDWLNAVSTIDVPDALYDTGVEFFHIRPWNERWKLLGMVRPAVRSDFSTSQEAFRVFGLAAAIWEYIPERLSVTLGAVYLGRSDIPALPAVGLVWTPDRKRRLELQFPRTRYFRRLAKDGANSELWSHLTIGIGGNTWAVTRSNGSEDEIALRDLRLTTGIEKIVSGGGGWFFETGIAFDRSLEFLSDESTISLGTGFIFSGGWAY